MQDNCQEAWKQRSITSHAVLENDDTKTYYVIKCQQTLKRLSKMVEGNVLSHDQPVPTMAEFLN
eukprot:2164238-Prymnesium_polylepis.1